MKSAHTLQPFKWDSEPDLDEVSKEALRSMLLAEEYNLTGGASIPIYSSDPGADPAPGSSSATAPGPLVRCVGKPLCSHSVMCSHNTNGVAYSTLPGEEDEPIDIVDERSSAGSTIAASPNPSLDAPEAVVAPAHEEEAVGDQQEEETDDDPDWSQYYGMDIPEVGVSDVERMACGEFFTGHHAKTPERYVKIRNYIVQRWRQSIPRYLTKTAVCVPRCFLRLEQRVRYPTGRDAWHAGAVRPEGLR